MSAKHLNLSTVIDKNKVETDKTFILMFEVGVKDSNGDLVNTLRFTKNSENVIFMGEEYVAANFDVDIKIEQNTEPSITLSAQDQTKTLASFIDAYDGLVTSDARLLVAHEESMDGPAEMDETFLIIDSTVSDYVVKFTLGVETAVAYRFPNFRQFRNRCSWKYKGVRCQYAGVMPTCDYTRDGANGCIAHGNELHFGGFPGLNDLF